MDNPITTAAEMREAAASLCNRMGTKHRSRNDLRSCDACDSCADEIRALPIAEREVPEAVREWRLLYGDKVKLGYSVEQAEIDMGMWIDEEYPDACK